MKASDRELDEEIEFSLRHFAEEHAYGSRERIVLGVQITKLLEDVLENRAELLRIATSSEVFQEVFPYNRDVSFACKFGHLQEMHMSELSEK